MPASQDFCRGSYTRGNVAEGVGLSLREHVDDARLRSLAFEEVRVGQSGGGACTQGRLRGFQTQTLNCSLSSPCPHRPGRSWRSARSSRSARLLIQSAFKPLSLAYALCALGTDAVTSAVANRGGKGYRAGTVEDDGRAHNAMINSGALSILQTLPKAGHEVEDVLQFLRGLAGVERGDESLVSVNEAAYRATLADSAHNVQFCRASENVWLPFPTRKMPLNARSTGTRSSTVWRQPLRRWLVWRLASRGQRSRAEAELLKLTRS